VVLSFERKHLENFLSLEELERSKVECRDSKQSKEDQGLRSIQEEPNHFRPLDPEGYVSVGHEIQRKEKVKG
jgi:hypothetical protein